MSRSYATMLLVGVSMLAFPVAALAQEQTVTPATAASTSDDHGAASPQGSQSSASDNTIVVTGTRLITNGNDNPTPLTVVPVQALQNVQPTMLSDNLNLLPEFSGSRSQSARPVGSQGAVSQLNLRNLGANRNLLLFDGHRIPPTLVDGTVDADMVPQMLIKRVDVVTGGVSAVYGSDAISGAINFVPDTNFTGLKLKIQGGISGHGDDAQEDAGVAYGTSLFGGKGHFEASYEFRNDAGIGRRTDRSWNNQWAVVGTGSTASPYYLASNVRDYRYSFGGLIVGGALAGQNFAANGVLTPFQHGTSTGSAIAEIGGDGAYYDPSMIGSLRSHQAFARLDYDVSDNVHAYIDFSGVMKTLHQFENPIILNKMTFSSSNAFLDPGYQAILQAAGQSTFKLSEFMSDQAPRMDAEADLSSFFVDAGLKGELGKFHWDVYAQHGWTEQKSITHSNINNQKLAAALDAVRDPSTGNIVCNVSLTNPGADPGCVPLNVFGPTAADPAAVSYFLADTTNITRTTLDDFAFSIAGSPFDLWAGPFNMAVSGEWRRQSLSVTDTAPDTALADCTGLRYNCSATTQLYQTSGGILDKVSEDVREIAVEADLPLLKNAPLIKSLSLNGAARYTDYSVSGNYWTWKVGAVWELNDTLKFRGALSRDIRAPTLYELYAPQTVTMSSYQDLLTGLAPVVPEYSGGNPNLTAEIGKTTTLGLVWTPSSSFSVSLDHYNITISNALSSIKGDNAPYQQACYASGGTSPTCELQTRPNGYSDTSATNAVTAWYDSNVNIAAVKTWGYDLEVNYKTEFGTRPFSARLLVNYQPHLIFADEISGTSLDHAGKAYSPGGRYAAPKWAATALVHYQPTEKLDIDLAEQWRSRLSDQHEGQVWIDPGIASFYTTNLTLTYAIDVGKGVAHAFFNIQNLFDKHPPPAAYYNSPNPGQYGWPVGDNPIGRYFTIGVRAEF